MTKKELNGVGVRMNLRPTSITDSNGLAYFERCKSNIFKERWL